MPFFITAGLSAACDLFDLVPQITQAQTSCAQHIKAVVFTTGKLGQLTLFYAAGVLLTITHKSCF